MMTKIDLPIGGLFEFSNCERYGFEFFQDGSSETGEGDREERMIPGGDGSRKMGRRFLLLFLGISVRGWKL